MTDPRKRKRRASEENPAPKSPPSDNTNSTADSRQFDYDRGVVDQVDASIWSAVYAGHFRLAVRCLGCGRWLTDGRSKQRHYGPRCAAKAVTK